MDLTTFSSAESQADAGGYNSGNAYVIFGKAAGFPATLSLGALDGTNGFTILRTGG